MNRKHFHLWHAILGTALLLIIEGALVWIMSGTNLRIAFVLLFALLGGIVNVLMATDVVEEVKNARHMLMVLSAVLALFIVYFAFQYGFLTAIVPGSFQGLTTNPIDTLLHSTMIFVFNPIYLPTTVAARALLLINTFTSLIVVLFVLQNIWQLRAPTKANS